MEKKIWKESKGLEGALKCSKRFCEELNNIFGTVGRPQTTSVSKKFRL